MKLSPKEMKIAKKILLSYSYRHKIWENNFDTNVNKGIVIFNYHHYPLFIVYNNGDDTFTGMKTFSSGDSFEKFQRISEYGHETLDVEYYLSDIINRYRWTQKNFRNALYNYIVANHAPCEDWGFLIDSSKTKTYNSEQIKNILTKDYDIRIEEVNKIINQQQESKSIVIDNLTFKSTEELDENKLKNITNEIKSLLNSSSLSSLLYGVVEVKDSFQNNRIGDYQSSTDVIRTGGENKNFIQTFIHELGHRWHFKRATQQQEKEFKRLYDNCRGKHIELNKGDIITFYNDENKYQYIGIGFSSLMFKNMNNNKTLYYKLIATRSMETINGKKVEKYKFPNNYSKTKFTEFIAVCIQYAYCNLPMDQELKQKVKQIVG